MHKHVLAALLVVAAAGAAAQNPTSSNENITPPGVRRGDAARSDPVFRHVVACVVRRDPARSRNLVASISGTNAESMIFGVYQSQLDQCYPRLMGGLGFTEALLRGGIAEYFYHEAFPTGLPAAAAGPPDAAASAWARARTSEGQVTRMESLHAVARCVVLRNGSAVRAMLAATPFSAAELEAIHAFQGDLAACITRGVRFTVSRQSLRGLIAEAALHYGEALARGFPADSADAAGPIGLWRPGERGRESLRQGRGERI